jgi:hypothetical protein
MNSLVTRLACLAFLTTIAAGAPIALADDAPAATPAPVPAPAADPAPAPAPPKDLPAAADVIAAAIDAMGGKEAIAKIESTRVKMLMVTPMGDLNMDMYSAKPAKFLVKQSMAGMGETTVGSDGTTGWMHNPMMGGHRLLEPDQAEQMETQANIFSLVLNLEEQYPTIETVDRVQFGGEEANKLRLVDKNLDERFALFSVKDKLMLGVEMTEDGPMGEQKVALSLGEWKQFDAVKLFTRLSFDQMGMPMEMNLTEVEFNKVEPSTFDLPAEVQELVKARDAAPASAPSPAPAPPPAPEPAPAPAHP